MNLSSGFFPTEVRGRLRVPGAIWQWNIDGPNPSGYKHFESGVYKPSAKIAFVGGFTAQRESGVALNLGSVYANNNGFYSDTVAMTFNFGEVNSHPSSFFNRASGIGTNFKGFNLRFWQYNISAISGYSPTFYYFTSSEWRQGFHLLSSTPGAQVLGSVMPATQNIFTSNGLFVSGVFKDREFSDFIYLVGKFPSGVTYTLGTYGGLGSGNLRFAFSYDWTGIDANVLTTDLT